LWCWNDDTRNAPRKIIMREIIYQVKLPVPVSLGVPNLVRLSFNFWRKITYGMSGGGSWMDHNPSSL
jgi:hypothetical protein